MPPRYSYWTILAGGLPTSFRAADRADLLPTLKRLQERHPDAEMKWFQRGKLWESPEMARAASERNTTLRGRDWRPGGEHRDRRETFRTKKREHNQKRRQQKFMRKHGGPEQNAPQNRSDNPQQRRGVPRQTQKSGHEQNASERPKGTARKQARSDSPQQRRSVPRQMQKGGRRR